MVDTSKIYVDDRLPATLMYDGKSVDCPTLQEAVLAFQRLASVQQSSAVVHCAGASYTADQIERLHRRHVPSAA